MQQRPAGMPGRQGQLSRRRWRRLSMDAASGRGRPSRPSPITAGQSPGRRLTGSTGWVPPSPPVLQLLHDAPTAGDRGGIGRGGETRGKAERGAWNQRPPCFPRSRSRGPPFHSNSPIRSWHPSWPGPRWAAGSRDKRGKSPRGPESLNGTRSAGTGRQLLSTCDTRPARAKARPGKKRKQYLECQAAKGSLDGIYLTHCII